MPGALDPGTAATALLIVRNLGTETWTAGGPIRVSYRWRGPGTSAVEGPRTVLPADVGPGQELTVCARIDAPAVAGEYQLEWDLVHEGIAWFSEERAINEVRVPVRVGPAGPAWGASSLRLLLFLLITIGHFVLAAAWLRTWTDGPGSRDAWLFAGVLFGLASLLAVLHAVACTIGLSFTSASAALAAWNVIVAAAVRRGTPASRLPRASVLEWIGGAALVVVVARWFVRATDSLLITGTDAAHYHAPNAVNFALGVSPLDFTATPHLYPMGSSVLAAWFILPLNDPLLIDLSTVPACLLALAALARLFRFVTGTSGLAWMTWLVLALLATPLLSVATLFSADLMYAAAFLALNTQLFVMARTRRATPLDLVLAAAAAGLLLGSKTTGAVSTVLLVAVHASIALAGGRPSLAAPRRSIAGWCAAAVLLAVAAGGIWPLRNWANYGSPIAPSGLTLFGTEVFAGDTAESTRYYLSVAKDMRDTSGYRVAARLAHYVRQWLGPWFLPSLLLVLIAAGDALRRWRGESAALSRARLVLIASAGVLTAAHLLLLAQAPWSSLEWTRGHSLRYALPFALLLPLLASLALFPLSWRWWERLPLASVSVPRPRWFTGALALAAALAGVSLLAARTAAADGRLRRGPQQLATQLRGCDAESVIAGDRYSAVYLAVLDHEQRTRACERRRFFITTRFDSPMALQPVPYTNAVIDARPRTIVERVFAEDGPGTQACDYVVASDAELQTDRGNALINRLRAEGALSDIDTPGPYTVFSAARGSKVR